MGSKHWTADPTLPLNRVKFMLNLDMIGALRADRVLVFGTRTALGLRRMASMSNQDGGLTLDFSWVMRGDADHYSFYDRGIPAIFLHTDLHERYHKPTDVASKINRDGMMRVARLAFAMLYQRAEAPVLPRFRPAAKAENEESHRRLEAAEPIVLRAGDSPMRLGISWRSDDAEPDAVIVSHVVAGSAAAAGGLRVGDRIYRVGGRDFSDDRAFAQLARTLPGPLELLVERDGRLRSVVLQFPLEGGKSKKNGVSGRCSRCFQRRPDRRINKCRGFNVSGTRNIPLKARVIQGSIFLAMGGAMSKKHGDYWQNGASFMVGLRYARPHHSYIRQGPMEKRNFLTQHTEIHRKEGDQTCRTGRSGIKTARSGPKVGQKRCENGQERGRLTLCLRL